MTDDILTFDLDMSIRHFHSVPVPRVTDGGSDGQRIDGRSGGEVCRLPRLGRVERAIVLLVPVGRAFLFRYRY